MGSSSVASSRLPRSRRLGAEFRSSVILFEKPTRLNQHGLMRGELEDPVRLRADLRTFVGVEATSAVPTVEVLSTAREEGFIRQLVHLVTDDDRVPALLAVPAGQGPFPAVVAFHQHAGQRHFGKSEWPHAIALLTSTHAPTGSGCWARADVVLARCPVRSSPASDGRERRFLVAASVSSRRRTT